MIGVGKARALRDEALARTYVTVAKVAEGRRVSESTVRTLIEQGLLPATDMTPDSQLRTLRIRSDDLLTLDARLAAYKRALARGEGETYLGSLRERWERREGEEIERAMAGDG